MRKPAKEALLESVHLSFHVCDHALEIAMGAVDELVVMFMLHLVWFFFQWKHISFFVPHCQAPDRILVTVILRKNDILKPDFHSRSEHAAGDADLDISIFYMAISSFCEAVYVESQCTSMGRLKNFFALSRMIFDGELSRLMVCIYSK